MPTPSRQLLSRTIYDTDGVTVNWDFSFSGGYLDRGHVKAYVDLPTGERTELTVTAGMFTGPYQLAITPAILSGRTLTIYRDTPKNLPLVDFTDGSGFSEVSLDIMAKQAVFVSAESVDTLNTSSNYEAAVAADAAQVSQLAAAASAASAAVSANSAAASAASINPASFATAAQGAKADTAIQPAGFTVAAINGATTLGRGLMAVVDAAAARVLLGLSTFGSSIVQAVDAAVARVLLGAAASGANNDITSLAALTAGGLPDNSVLTADIANAAVTPAKLSQPSTLGTVVATTSGTAIDFTGIPAWAKRITVMLNGVSTTGSNIIVQLGTSGSFETTGYDGGSWQANTTITAYSTGFMLGNSNAAAANVKETLVLNLFDPATNTYVAFGTGAVNSAGGGNAHIQGGSKALSGALTRIRITTVNGTDTFDLGSANLLIE